MAPTIGISNAPYNHGTMITVIKLVFIWQLQGLTKHSLRALKFLTTFIW